VSEQGAKEYFVHEFHLSKVFIMDSEDLLIYDCEQVLSIVQSSLLTNRIILPNLNFMVVGPSALYALTKDSTQLQILDK
jgi:hypothetical protein